MNILISITTLALSSLALGGRFRRLIVREREIDKRAGVIVGCQHGDCGDTL